jgi:hypothetical protein
MQFNDLTHISEEHAGHSNDDDVPVHPDSGEEDMFPHL